MLFHPAIVIIENCKKTNQNYFGTADHQGSKLPCLAYKQEKQCQLNLHYK